MDVFFLGYKISFRKNFFNYLEKKLVIKKKLSSIFFKNLRFNKIFLKKFYYELSLYSLNAFTNLKLTFNIHIFNRILNFIFKFDTIRFIKLNYSFFKLNFIFLDSTSFFQRIFTNYSNYFFDSLVNSLYCSFKDKGLKSLFDSSFMIVYSLDFCLKDIFNEFLFKYRFFFNCTFLFNF